jgi:hypothetical protein
LLSQRTPDEVSGCFDFSILPSVKDTAREHDDVVRVPAHETQFYAMPATTPSLVKIAHCRLNSCFRNTSGNGLHLLQLMQPIP